MDAVILMVVFVVCLALPFALAKLWLWFYFWLALAVTLAIFELVSYLTTKKTLSQAFWKYRKEHPKAKWWLFAGMSVFWLYLLVHLFLEV